MIDRLEVKGLNRRFDYDLKFYDDMNVLTGLNGSGKTTLLKLMWYLISGNLHRIISEIPFTSVNVTTSWFDLSMEQEESKDVTTLKWETPGASQPETEDLKVKSSTDLSELNTRIANIVPGSLFFPTFRRCELGKTGFPDGSAYDKLQEAMLALSKAISSNESHKFITITSMGDIDPLLIPKIKQLQDYQDNSEEKNTVEERFSLLRALINDIYIDYKNIVISTNISFEGKGKWTISSENLSSGEKQLLGFLCHNAFSVDPVMFLDEPELSLHMDYQRMILHLLIAQGTERQFFVATHSPFIYSRFSEREINLNLKENTNNESKS